MFIFFHERKNATVPVLFVALYVGVIIFLVMSLISYDPTDSSWIYACSDGVKTTNAGGVIGAYVASLLFYFFGGAAFLLFLPLLWGLYMCILGYSMREEWERCGASVYSVFIGATLCQIYGYDGGVSGLWCSHVLVYYGDSIGCILFLAMSVSICIILLLRWSFVRMVQGLVSAVCYGITMMRQYHVVSTIARIIIVFFYAVVIKPVIFLMTFTRSLVNGDAFIDTGLIVPDESYKHNDFVVQKNINFFVIKLSQRTLNVALKKEIDFVCISYKRVISPHAYAEEIKDDEHKQQELSHEINQETIIKIPAKKTLRYVLPHNDIFSTEKIVQYNYDQERELQERAHILCDKLKRFGVTGKVVAIKRGPVVTLFEYQPDVDTKLSKIIALEDDLAMALQAMSIRILAPIPGRSVVGFEVANNNCNDVLFSEIVTSPIYKTFIGLLPLVLGKGTAGEIVIVDLVRMPHLLIAGSTGSGKSVALNALLMSLLCKMNPDELKLILIDPKRLEFASFTDIAHLLFPIVTSPVAAAPVLRWVVQEMEDRYEKMAHKGVRNISDYNTRIIHGQCEDTDKPLPFIVVMIDELADLMITAGRDIEDLITRITQMARAAGIHMIVATQRPSVDVITGLIKANFPSRISFRVASRVDSRTILDTMGADRLLGRGDMLFLDAATSQLRRVHGAYVSDKEIECVADHIRSQRKVEYLDHHQDITAQGNDLHPTDDVLYKDVRQYLDEIDEISISLLQRKFRIGYNRSARIIDMLESQGLIMPQNGGKTRKVIR